MLLLQHSVNPPILTGALEDSKFCFIEVLRNFQNDQEGPLVGKGVKINKGDACNPYISDIYPIRSIYRASGCPILEFFGLFWIYFGTGNVLEKIPFFFRLVLELFLNSEFLTIRFLCYSIYGCPLFGSPLCDKILFPFCQR